MCAEDAVELSFARGARDVDAVRKLMREYLAWHGRCYSAHRDLLEKYFDYAGYQSEMDQLPGEYNLSRSCLLLARREKTVVGCVALRDLGDGISEMKRMFVMPHAQGTGVGKRLATSVMKIAAALGYSRMRLDTGPLQTAAIAMYRSLGFDFVDPYYELPAELGDLLVFMECDLTRDGR